MSRPSRETAMTRFTAFADSDDLLVDSTTVHVECLVPATVSDTWELLVSCPELWLGDAVRIEQTGRYAVDGCSGQRARARPDRGGRRARTHRPHLAAGQLGHPRPGRDLRRRGGRRPDPRVRPRRGRPRAGRPRLRVGALAGCPGPVGRAGRRDSRDMETARRRTPPNPRRNRARPAPPPTRPRAAGTPARRRWTRPASRQGTVTFCGPGRKPTTSITHQYAEPGSSRPLAAR